MLLLFDRREINDEFKSTLYLSEHLEFTDFVEVILKNKIESLNSDRYYNADIWCLIESSPAFSSEDFIMSVTDDYLATMDLMIETFTDFLLTFIIAKSNIDLRNTEVKKISFNNNYVIIEI